ncbi:MAG: MarR family transcriptional regulator [Lachnospiraceae bacterium]|nr:MarR family transcriptional regulator [Lachnospiraceae bacterium]
MDAKGTINQVLVRLFRRINYLEERAICQDKYKNITLNEVHVIEAIGEDGDKNMTAVAKALDVTTGTLTISVNSLVRKGLVKRIRSEEDRRVVLISLTDQGRELNHRHVDFHRRMIDEIIEGLSEEEVGVLTEMLGKLNDFFMTEGYNG